MKSSSMRGVLGAASATIVVAVGGGAMLAAPAYADYYSSDKKQQSATTSTTSTDEPAATDQSRSTAGTSAGDEKSRRAGEMLDDTVITSKVKAAFVVDDTVSALRINVTSNSGVVQLSGFANSTKEAERAAEVARKVAGVKDVKNDIVVKQQQ